MSKVYIVTHEIYSYENHDYDTSVEVFDSLESAMNYYLMKKEIVLKTGKVREAVRATLSIARRQKSCTQCL